MKMGEPLTGYPGALFKVAARYGEVPPPNFVTLFPHPPQFNKPSTYFVPKKVAVADDQANPYHKQYGYLRSPLLGDYRRVHDALRGSRFILTLGELAFWCLSGDKMLDHRGTISYWEGTRVIPTHHPRDIVRQHHLLPVLAMDLKKAYRESLHPKSVFPARRIEIAETVGDVISATNYILSQGRFAFDIETHEGEITMICFAPSPTEVYVFPIFFHDKRFWDEAGEKVVWQNISKLLSSPCAKVAHNATYDITYLRAKGIPIQYPVDDTMLLSHSDEIEWLKSLGFLGSIYCNEKSWKLMRIGRVKDRNKADE